MHACMHTCVCVCVCVCVCLCVCGCLYTRADLHNLMLVLHTICVCMRKRCLGACLCVFKEGGGCVSECMCELCVSECTLCMCMHVCMFA